MKVRVDRVGRAMRIAHGGCTTLPPTIRHNDRTWAWQRYGVLLKTPDIQRNRLVEDRALTNLAIAHDSIIASRSFQKHYASRHRTAERPFKTGDLVCLLTKNLNLPKGRAHKLLSIYTGPYYVTSSNVSVSNYALDLPGEPRARNIHPTF